MHGILASASISFTIWSSLTLLLSGTSLTAITAFFIDTTLKSLWMRAKMRYITTHNNYIYVIQFRL